MEINLADAVIAKSDLEADLTYFNTVADKDIAMAGSNGLYILHKNLNIWYDFPDHPDFPIEEDARLAFKTSGLITTGAPVPINNYLARTWGDYHLLKSIIFTWKDPFGSIPDIFEVYTLKRNGDPSISGDWELIHTSTGVIGAEYSVPITYPIWTKGVKFKNVGTVQADIGKFAVYISKFQTEITRNTESYVSDLIRSSGDANFTFMVDLPSSKRVKEINYYSDEYTASNIVVEVSEDKTSWTPQVWGTDITDDNDQGFYSGGTPGFYIFGFVIENSRPPSVFFKLTDMAGNAQDMPSGFAKSMILYLKADTPLTETLYFGLCRLINGKFVLLSYGSSSFTLTTLFAQYSVSFSNFNHELNSDDYFFISRAGPNYGQIFIAQKGGAGATVNDPFAIGRWDLTSSPPQEIEAKSVWPSSGSFFILKNNTMKTYCKVTTHQAKSLTLNDYAKAVKITLVTPLTGNKKIGKLVITNYRDTELEFYDKDMVPITGDFNIDFIIGSPGSVKKVIVKNVSGADKTSIQYGPSIRPDGGSVFLECSLDENFVSESGISRNCIYNKLSGTELIPEPHCAANNINWKKSCSITLPGYAGCGKGCTLANGCGIDGMGYDGLTEPLDGFVSGIKESVVTIPNAGTIEIFCRSNIPAGEDTTNRAYSFDVCTRIAS